MHVLKNKNAAVAKAPETIANTSGPLTKKVLAIKNPAAAPRKEMTLEEIPLFRLFSASLADCFIDLFKLITVKTKIGKPVWVSRLFFALISYLCRDKLIKESRYCIENGSGIFCIFVIERIACFVGGLFCAICEVTHCLDSEIGLVVLEELCELRI